MAIDVAQTIAADVARCDPVNGIRIVGIDGPSGSGKSFLAAQTSKLVLLRAEDGTVRFRQELRVNGHRVVPFSLARLSPGRLAIGTLDGRVLVCSLDWLPHPD